MHLNEMIFNSVHNEKKNKYYRKAVMFLVL